MEHRERILHKLGGVITGLGALILLGTCGTTDIGWRELVLQGALSIVLLAIGTLIRAWP